MISSTERRMSPDLAGRFEREAMPYREQLLRAALQMTRDRHDAEDLVQEAITRACAGYYRFAHGTNIRAWLHRILVNTFINGYRKRQREPVVTVSEPEQLQAYASAHLAGASMSAEEHVLSRMPADKLMDALRDLPPEFRQVMFLVDVEGYSYRETAAIMETPLGTVMSRLHRARTSLRSRLADTPDGSVA
jgi:RNA polymerase sigma-70 factor, ECF subfamily